SLFGPRVSRSQSSRRRDQPVPRARAVADGWDTLDPVGLDSTVRCGTAAPPVPPSAPWSAGGLEVSGASPRGPGLMIGGGEGEPASRRHPGRTGRPLRPPRPADGALRCYGAETLRVSGYGAEPLRVSEMGAFCSALGFRESA